MVLVKLSAEERELLLEVLENTTGDLRAEIAHSDSPFFKDGLRRRKQMLYHIIEQVKRAEEELPAGRKQPTP